MLSLPKIWAVKKQIGELGRNFMGLFSMRNEVLKFDISSNLDVRARMFIFSDPRSKALLPLIKRTARSDATILISGETGTGKELVARYIYQMSDRAQRPFIAVNCGAFSETLIESELFGHERGAFTGAVSARPGWFELANGGTLFLDEIGDLPYSLQVKLLRVLQEREVVRIGARHPVRLDVRLIAATNVDLRAAVDAGRFREDLYYRLGVINLPLLPLRERRGDILPLARHFLTIYGENASTPIISFSPDAEEIIFNHNWRGNIRELENVIQRAALMCTGPIVQPEHLGLSPPSEQSTVIPVSSPPRLEQIRSILSKLIANGEAQILDRLINLAVDEAYALSKQNQVHTAQALGVTRNVVRTYLKNAGLLSPGEV